MRTLAIGDIHGCLTALETLLQSLELQPDDRLIFLGDYIDRGPDSRGVIEKLIELSTHPQHVFLRGNHDDWILRARFERSWFDTWLGVGGEETLTSYGAFSVEDVLETHLEFLESTRFFFQTEEHIFVHASLSSKPPHQNSEQTLMWGKFANIVTPIGGQRVICGHSAQRNGLPAQREHAVCIDTFCYGGGWLSALDVWEDKIFQANEQGQTRQFRLGEAP